MHLTLAEIKAAGLAAYQAGQLSAQGPAPACLYRDEAGRPCIIGAAMPDEFFDNDPEHNEFWGVSLTNLVNLNHVEMDMDELPAAQRLQRIHDRWADIARGAIQPYYSANHLPELEGLTAEELEALLVKELSE